MMLDKLERHTAYIIMLAEVNYLKEKGYSVFMCHVFADMQGKMYAEGLHLMYQMLPELIDKKPPSAPYAWFHEYDYDSRIKILEECIAETYEP